MRLRRQRGQEGEIIQAELGNNHQRALDTTTDGIIHHGISLPRLVRLLDIAAMIRRRRERREQKRRSLEG